MGCVCTAGQLEVAGARLVIFDCTCCHVLSLLSRVLTITELKQTILWGDGGDGVRKITKSFFLIVDLCVLKST